MDFLFFTHAGKIGVLLSHVNIDKRRKMVGCAEILDVIDEMPKHRPTSTTARKTKKNKYISQWLRREYIII